MAALEELVLAALVNRALLPLLTVDQQARLREVRRELEAAPAKEVDLARKIETLLDAVEAGASAAMTRYRQREAELEAHRAAVARLKAEEAELAFKEGGAPGACLGDRLRALELPRQQDREQFTRKAAALLGDTLSAVVCTAEQGSSLWRVELLDLAGDCIDAVQMFSAKLTIDDAWFSGLAIARSIELDEVADPASLTALPDAEEVAAQRVPPKRLRAAP